MKAMRDALLEEIYKKMQADESIFFLSADFGALILDKIRIDFPQRFINVGIAEQNLINIACGLALEGMKVFVYAIAPFLTMRAYEQIRINLAILSQLRSLNVNLIGVGAGVSYAMSGPTHHSLEDLSIISILPNINLYSPSDNTILSQYLEYELSRNKPSYIRLDAKPLPKLKINYDFADGFRVYHHKNKTNQVIIASGYMVHKALNKKNNDVIDLFALRSFNKEKLQNIIKQYEKVVWSFEGFSDIGSDIINLSQEKVSIKTFQKEYSFYIGERDTIHKKYAL